MAAHLYLRTPCPMKLATGLDCAGCGGTRAIEAVVRGEVAVALDLNALVIALPGLAVLHLFLRRLSAKPPARRIDEYWLAIALLASWTVLRNLPGLDLLRAAS